MNLDFANIQNRVVNNFLLFLLASFFAILVNSCSSMQPLEPIAPIPAYPDMEQPEPEGLVLSSCPVEVNDDKSPASLLKALESTEKYYNSLPANTTQDFGGTSYSKKQLLASINLLRRLIEDPAWLTESRYSIVNEYFDCYKMTTKAKTLFTGYYTPEVRGSLKYSAKYPVPVYAIPSNRKVLDLGKYRASLAGKNIIYRIEDNDIQPYFERNEIVSGSIKGSAKVLAWVEDDIDFFFMQIQGAGILLLENNKRMLLKYAGSNGRDYSSIGSYLVQKRQIKLDDVNLHSLKTYLRANPAQKDEVLNYNKSFVFYELQPFNGEITGSISVPLTSYRSAAFDSSLLPRGALAFTKVQIPYCDDAGNCNGTLHDFNQFLFNQDTGGAIKGYARIDLYCGTGRKAEAQCGQLKHEGEVYFIVAKMSAINTQN